MRLLNVKKRIIALLLTIFLGAGVGHLYLKKFLKAGILLGINFTLTFFIFSQIGKDKLLESTNPALLLAEYLQGADRLSLYYDLLVAGLLSYAIVDIWRLTEINNGK